MVEHSPQILTSEEEAATIVMQWRLCLNFAKAVKEASSTLPGLSAVLVLTSHQETDSSAHLDK